MSVNYQSPAFLFFLGIISFLSAFFLYPMALFSELSSFLCVYLQFLTQNHFIKFDVTGETPID